MRRRRGRTDPRIWGGFVEHMGRCVNGGIHDPASPLARADGFRPDVLAALREIGFTGLRYPGGNFNCTYRWEDGVGPRAARPRRFVPAWRQEEPNAVGTDEFLPLCAELGMEPYLCVNLGTEGPAEAAAWLEYVNGRTDTHHANRRRAHGFAAPWDVKLWGLGNEVDGPWNVGWKTAPQYVDAARETAKILKSVDRSVELVACGSVSNDPRWNFEVCDALFDAVDFLAVHLYVGQEELRGHLGSPLVLEDWLDAAEAAITLARRAREGGRRPAIAVDEWNVWYKDMNFPWIEEVYDQADAVVAAGLLFAMLRRPATVKLASLAQAVNVIAPIRTRPDGLVRQTLFHAFRLLRWNLLPIVLDAALEGESYSAVVARRLDPRKPFLPREIPLVDAVATLSEDGRRLAVAALSRDLERERTIALDVAGASLAGAPRVVELAADDPRAVNDFDAPARVHPVDRTGAADGMLRLRPCSLQVAIFELH